MNLVDELHAVSAALAADGIRYAVCGGVAVTAHGAARMTRDIDILVARADLPRVLDLVRPLGYAFLALPMAFDEGTPRERHVQRISKLAGKEHLPLDFLIAEGALADALDDRIELSLDQGTVAFVSRATLLRLKRFAGRTQDLADIEKLEALDGK